jgi:hypothetical protein
MSFWGRVWSGISGQAKKRLPKQLALLGAPPALVQEASRKSDEEQEALFFEFTKGRHACTLDWRATAADVLEGLGPLLSDDEKRLLPRAAELPDDATRAIAKIRSALEPSQRTLVHTESLGDFSFLILVPKTVAAEFVACVGPWLIE